MSQHVLQLYENDAFLNEEVLDFLSAGLCRGDSALIIARRPRLQQLQQKLRRHAPLEDAQQNDYGNCILLDASDTLSRFMVNGWPDERRFMTVIGTAIREASDDGKTHVRAFGEMVSALCDEGRHEAAAELEVWWNKLSEQYPFSLLCAYPMQDFAADAHRPVFKRICSAHSRIYPAETCQVMREPDELHSIIAKLQQQTRALETEVIRRKEAEQALQDLQQQLRALALHMADIIEDERKRIARELHDELGQNLLALRMEVLSMGEAAGDAQRRLAPHIASALSNIDITIKNVRSIINDLRPAVLDLGLHAAIEWEVREFERRSGIVCRLIADRDEYNVDDARAMALFRILQESLNNVMRHSYANRVEIRLCSEGDRIRMRVSDNGVGAYPGCRRKTNAFGLLGIRERVGALGGDVTIETDRGKGMVLSVALPLGQG